MPAGEVRNELHYELDVAMCCSVSLMFNTVTVHGSPVTFCTTASSETWRGDEGHERRERHGGRERDGAGGERDLSCLDTSLCSCLERQTSQEPIATSDIVLNLACQHLIGWHPL